VTRSYDLRAPVIVWLYRANGHFYGRSLGKFSKRHVEKLRLDNCNYGIQSSAQSGVYLRYYDELTYYLLYFIISARSKTKMRKYD